MNAAELNDEDRRCPLCHSCEFVRPKLMLLARYEDEHLRRVGECEGCRPLSSPSVQECDADQLRAAPMEQFANGFFCDRCQRGFISDALVVKSLSDASAQARVMTPPI